MSYDTLPFGVDSGGDAIERWRSRLTAYLDGMASVEEVRQHSQGQRPWPLPDNPMLGYLLDRASEMLKESKQSDVLIWLAVHAWFEGAIAEKAAVLTDLSR